MWEKLLEPFERPLVLFASSNAQDTFGRPVALELPDFVVCIMGGIVRYEPTVQEGHVANGERIEISWSGRSRSSHNR
jgi:hypothetical protein